jgi:hypothetical protein
LNAVVVGWNDSSAQVSSVKDTVGNTYQLAIGPMTTGLVSQSIYFAKNIRTAAPGINSVVVTFVTAAVAPDVRIMEYKGLDTTNPMDVVVGATGNSATSGSGTLATTSVPTVHLPSDCLRIPTATSLRIRRPPMQGLTAPIRCSLGRAIG